MEDTESLAEPAAVAPIRTGEHFGLTLRFSAAQIEEFARLSLDAAPLHGAGRAGGAVFASSQHSAAIMMGLVSSHFSRGEDGISREAQCLNFNFAFKAPIRAGREIRLQWFVSGVEFNSRLDGWIGQLNGSAYSDGADCVVARGTVLVRQTH